MSLRLDPPVVIAELRFQAACRVVIHVEKTAAGVIGRCRKVPVAICLTRAGQRHWYPIGALPPEPATKDAFLQALDALLGPAAAEVTT